ncbi:prepilin peptidase-dependent protein [Cedecea davisae]|uniref:Prepilin peptidase-dependent protein n=1 Tax=Cedecea davisae TaxID=158484 RepID=A0ABS6DBR9_9ENTR|nr:prepilin peptidase-dependent protein [Cedecea davisae]MBU4680657.1 prepilin peptidase-dependent protein [Cedecea davisae]MBU4685679.1 prepilin peptidase-dependent protein [Cedecea davisae]
MNRTQSGFSLVEMMVVMAIIAVLSAGGFHGWQQWQQRQHLWQTAQQLRHFLAHLRNDANWHNRTHLIKLEQNGESWNLTSSQRLAGRAEDDVRLQFSPEFKGISVEDISSGLGFYGVRNTAWPGHIVLTSAAGKWKVTLSVWGRTRLCEVAEGKPC